MELLIGCGAARDMRISVNGQREWSKLVTLDNNPAHKPDVLHDLGVFPWPFEDDTFDSVHAYEILEHLGQQGDARAYFRDMGEVWRILKPGGFLAATCPSYRSMWAFGDPSHTRVLCSGSLAFLDQEQYRKQVDTPETRTSMSDFRHIWRGDFAAVWVQEDEERLAFVLQAVKPSRLTLDTAEAQALVSA